MAIAPSLVRTRFPDLSIDADTLALRLRCLPHNFARALLEERERWALWLPVAFGTGVGIYFALPVEPQRVFVVALACLSFTAVLGAFIINRRFPRVCCIGCA